LINGITEIGPGESVIVMVATNFTAPGIFIDYWGPDYDLDGIQVGYAGGSGLSQNGDGVTLYLGTSPSINTQVDNEIFPAGGSGASYDVVLSAFSMEGQGDNGLGTAEALANGGSVITASPGNQGVLPPDCINLGLDFGDTCDDGDPNTINDIVTMDCNCEGTANPPSSLTPIDLAAFTSDCGVTDLAVPDLSGITYNPNTGFFYGARNDGNLVEFDGDGNITQTVSILGISADAEGITYMYNDFYAITDERVRNIHVVSIVNNAGVLNVTLIGTMFSNGDIGDGTNDGFEGVAYDLAANILYVGKEGDEDSNNTGSEPRVIAINDPIALLGQTIDPLNDAFTIFPTCPNLDISGLSMTENGSLLMVSEQCGTVYEVDPANGSLLSEIAVPFVAPEGVIALSTSEMWIVGEVDATNSSQIGKFVIPNASCASACFADATWNSNCDCTGTILIDADGDGVCAEFDPDDTNACVPNNTDSDGDGFCGAQDPDDNDPCIPDPNSPACEGDDCFTDNFIDFENGWEDWVDGGSDAAVDTYAQAFSGTNCLFLRDNTDESTATSPSFDYTNKNSLIVSFTYITESMESGEDFWLQISTDGGNSYTTLVSYVSGIDYNNGVREFVTENIAGPFTNDTRIRLRCDASSNFDRVYIDDIKIESCSSELPPTCEDGILNNLEEFVDCGGPNCDPCPCVNTAQIDTEVICPAVFEPVCGCDGVTYVNECEAIYYGGVTSWEVGACDAIPCVDFYATDFETGYGEFNDAGSDCRRSINDSAYANSGSYCIRLRDNTSTSNTFSEIYNFSGFNGIQVSFTYIAESMEPGEDLWLQVSTDAGASYTTVADYDSGDEFVNGVREFETVYIPGPLGPNCRIRFALDASNNGDYVYIDDVLIETCSDGTIETCDDGVLNNGETYVDCGGPNCEPCPCINTAQIDLEINCIDVVDPVCGCDGVEYVNSCEAENYYGITDWTAGACPTCDDGILNGNEIDVDCGGPDCEPCNSDNCATYDFNNLEAGLGGWIDGGSDCRRSINDAEYAYSGDYCIRLRDDTGSSVFISPTYTVPPSDFTALSFTYITQSMETGESFHFEISLDEGISWTNLLSYVSGSNFQNGVRKFEFAALPTAQNTTVRFRFRCDASNNGDLVYIDDIHLEACTLNGAIGDGDDDAMLVENSDIEISKTELDGNRSLEDGNQIKLYPNPVSKSAELHLEFDKEMPVLKTQIFGFDGTLVSEQDWMDKESVIKISTQNLKPGTYLMRISSLDATVVKKFIVME